MQDSGILQQVVFSSKTREKWRLVIDLSVLNKHLSVLTFKMEAAEVIRNAMCKGEWVVSIDLTDAYFHIPIHKKSQHLLRFHVAGQTYQFWALPFGIATAPLEFTRVVKEVKLMLQNRGIRIHQYLADWLLCPIRRSLLRTVKGTSRVRSKAWVGNQLPKIRAKAYSKFQLPRLQVRLGQGRSLTHRKEMADLDKIHRTKQLDHYTQDSNVFHRDSSISRKNSSNGQITYETFPVVPENPLEVSPIFGRSDTILRDFEKASELVEGSKLCVDRVSSPCKRTQSTTIHRCVRQGLGYTFGKPDSQWNVVGHEANLHINILELKAVFLAIRSFQTHLVSKRALVASDNATAVSYLNKQGGTHSLEMCLMVWRLMAFCNPRAILLRVRNIQGCLNIIKDSRSCRDKIIQTEWSLHPNFFQMICQIWHRPMVDMFATKMNYLFMY